MEKLLLEKSKINARVWTSYCKYGKLTPEYRKLTLEYEDFIAGKFIARVQKVITRVWKSVLPTGKRIYLWPAINL